MTIKIKRYKEDYPEYLFNIIKVTNRIDNEEYKYGYFAAEPVIFQYVYKISDCEYVKDLDRDKYFVIDGEWVD